MRWSIVRLIWLRELRDQLRDRRTVFMIAVLPVLLYPVAGLSLAQLAQAFFKQPNVVAVVGSQHLPQPRPPHLAAADAAVWLAALPAGPTVPLAGVERLSAAASLHQARRPDYPPLFAPGPDGQPQLLPGYLDGSDPA